MAEHYANEIHRLSAEIERLRALLADIWRMWAKENQDGDNVLAACGERIKIALSDEQEPICPVCEIIGGEQCYRRDCPRR